MLQIAKNFEQREKAKPVMQQAKGPTEQVNYTGTITPSKSEQNWGQGQSSLQSKTDICSIVQGLHIFAPYAQLQTSDVLRRALGAFDIFVERVHPLLPNLWSP